MNLLSVRRVSIASAGACHIIWALRSCMELSLPESKSLATGESLLSRGLKLPEGTTNNKKIKKTTRDYSKHWILYYNRNIYTTIWMLQIMRQHYPSRSKWSYYSSCFDSRIHFNEIYTQAVNIKNGKKPAHRQLILKMGRNLHTGSLLTF